jgi:hypothetical protein
VLLVLLLEDLGGGGGGANGRGSLRLYGKRLFFALTRSPYNAYTPAPQKAKVPTEQLFTHIIQV